MLLQLCLRGEWLALEQSIKGLDRGDPELSAVDEVGYGGRHQAEGNETHAVNVL